MGKRRKGRRANRPTIAALEGYGYTRAVFARRQHPQLPPHYGPDVTVLDDMWIMWHMAAWFDFICLRDGLQCQWCDKWVFPDPRRRLRHSNPGRASLDHLRPVSRDGSHTPFNLLLACAGCNELRLNVDWRVFAQYLNREVIMRQRVEQAQWKTYQYLLTEDRAPIYTWCALDLYRHGQHLVFGTAINPQSGILPQGFIFEDTGYWGVPLEPIGEGTVLGKLRRLRRRHMGRDARYIG